TDHKYSKQEQDEFMKLFMTRWTKIDSANTAELKKLLKQYDWITISKFGEKADRDAWLLVQHADLDVPFQKEILKKLTILVKKGETFKQNFAYLHERVAVADKRPQRYGTQGRCTGPQQWEPNELESPADVNKLRAEVGLNTLEDYKKDVRRFCR